MRRDKFRMLRQEAKKILPKKVNVTAVGSQRFCKYGRIYGDGLRSQSIMIVPINRNQNNNWKVG